MLQRQSVVAFLIPYLCRVVMMREQLLLRDIPRIPHKKAVGFSDIRYAWAILTGLQAQSVIPKSGNSLGCLLTDNLIIDTINLLVPKDEQVS